MTAFAAASLKSGLPLDYRQEHLTTSQLEPKPAECGTVSIASLTLSGSIRRAKLRVFQIISIKAVGEPVADFGEHGAGFRRRSAGGRSLCASRLDLDSALHGVDNGWGNRQAWCRLPLRKPASQSMR